MKKTLKIFILFALLFTYRYSIAQSIINAGNDTTVCLPGSLTLNASLSSQSPTILSDALNSLSDDVFAPNVVNIGFNFTFFGNTYSQCVISTNNYISFDLANAGAFSPWTIGAPIPGGPNTTFNAIMGPWQDLLPPSGGTIRYITVGTAPNRIFIVEYCSVSMFSCTTLSFSSQIQLHENGSVIETHIIDKPICPTWNTGQAIHGIQNSTGTIAFVNAGRNAGVQWSATNEGTRFEIDPNDPNNYFISSIPFAPVTLGAAGTISWSEVGGPVLGTGNSITVNPSVATSYVASIDDLCSGFQYYDTVTVNAAPTPDLSYTYPSATFCIDTIIVTPTLGPGSVGDFSATPAGIVFTNTTTGAIDLGASTPGTYSISRIGTNGGCYDTLTVQITITSAPDPSHSYATSVFCPGGDAPTPVFLPNASAGLFTVSPAGLTFVNANTGEVDVANTTPGTYTITNTITGFGCPTTTDTSVVTIANQSIDAGADLSTCTGLNALLQGIATGPNSSNLTWSGGTGTYGNINNDTTSYSPTINDATGVPFNLVLTMNGTSTCPSIFDVVQLTVELGAVANAGSDVNLCNSGGSPLILNGSVSGLATTGSWSTPGTGSFGNAAALSTIYTPSAADLANGSVIIILTTDDPAGNCNPAVDTLLATFSTQPTISLNLQNSICAGSSLSLTASSSGSISSYQWNSNGTGTFSNPTSATTQYTPSPADIANGSVIFTVNGVAPAPCNTVTVSDTVVIVPAPVATFNGGGVVQTGFGTTCPNGTAADVNINIVGNGPFNITYTVGLDTLTLNNISSPFVYQDSIPGPFNIINVTDQGSCPGIANGSAFIDTVNIRYIMISQAETCGELNGVAYVNNVTGGDLPYAFLWNNGNTNDTISDLLTGNYSVTISDANNCTSSQSVMVVQNLGIFPAIEATPISGPNPLNVVFTNNTTGALTYSWNFGDGDTSTSVAPTHLYEMQGTYQVILTAYNTPACVTYDTLTIVVDGEVPNIFTPNGDGSNDKFKFNQLSVTSFNAEIFNRWGKKVYEWSDPNEGWDGSNAEAGVYYYIVQMVTLTGQNEELHGTITLLK